MIRAAVVLVGLVTTCGARNAVAHDGHGETVVMTGTIQAIVSGRILIETRDDMSFQVKRVWVMTTESTRYRRGKERVAADAAPLTAGERAVVVATSEDTDDYSQQLVALQVELSDARRRHLEIKIRTPTGAVLSIVVTERTAARDDER